MSCDGCEEKTKDLFLCSHDHLLCRRCIQTIIDSQCPKCKNVKSEEEPSVVDMPTGTTPKKPIIPIKSNHAVKPPLAMNQSEMRTKHADVHRKDHADNDIRQQLYNKYYLDPLLQSTSVQKSDMAQCAEYLEMKNISEPGSSIETIHSHNDSHPSTASSRRDEAIRRSEELLRDQILTKVFSNWDTSDKNNLRNSVVLPRSIKQVTSPEMRRKYESQINPTRLEQSRPSINTTVLKSPIPHAIFIPNTIIPDMIPNSHHRLALGQGDETVQKPINETNKTKDESSNSNQDLPPEKFVEFIMEKFQNMSLTNIKNLLTQLPGTLTQPPNEAAFNIYMRGTEVQTEPTEDVYASAAETQPVFMAFRASVRNDFVSGEPVMQTASIEPFDNVSMPTEPVQKLMTFFDLKMPRNPVECPISTCKNTQVFVSDFTRHIKMNHVRVPVEVLQPQTVSNFFVDPTLDDMGKNRCRMLYLVPDKIKDLGRTHYKNYLPLMVMTTRLRISDLFPTIRHKVTDAQSIFMMWLTGICPVQHPVYMTLCAWARRHKNHPELHRVQSGKLYCIREPQTGDAVFRNGSALILTSDQCKAITCDGKSLLKLQLMVH